MAEWDPAEQSSSSPSSENGSDDQFDYGFDDELANPDDGRPAAADTWAATHQAEDLVAAEREQAINAMFMFSDHFKKTFARSVHLCIRDPDGIAFSEIPGMDGMSSEAVKLKANIVFDQEQSYLELNARLRRAEGSTATFFDEHQHMSLRFYVDCIRNITRMGCERVAADHQLPPLLNQYRRAREYHEDNELWVLTFDYDPELVVAEGLCDTPTFHGAAQTHLVQTFANILKTDRLYLYMRLQSDSFQNTVENLKEKWGPEFRRPAFNEYRSIATQKPIIQWGNRNFGEDKDIYERRVVLTFRHIDHFAITHGYGVMRDVTPALKSALAALDTAMYASFVRLPNCKIFGGRPTKYLAFVQCDNEGLRRKFFDVGQCGTVAFERLDFHRGTIRTGWRYIVRPPFLGADYSDNVILQLKRPKDDTRDIIDCLAPSPDMPQIQVWAFPDIPHPRRLVGCAKLLTTLEGSEADEMRRYICALDLSESKAKLNLFPPQHRVREMPTTFAKFLTLTARLLSWTGWPIFNPSDVDKFLQQLSGSQLNAYDHLVDSRHPVVLYQGPPGTGKTTFVSTILAIASSLNIPWIACAPSNAATDHLATVMEKKCPGFGIIRFHPLHSETRALRKKGSELSAESNPDQAAGEERAQNDRVGVNAGSPIGEASQAFYAYLLNLQQTPELEGSRTQRPNFKNMSLSVRALQNVGLLNHDIPCFRAPKNDEPQNEFRDALVKQGFAEGKSEAEKSAYKQAEDRLMLDTIRKTTGLVTTLSNTADTTLRRAKRPRLVVIDECCQSTELETLLAWAHNTETVLILVLVGDPQQLPPTVVTKDSNRGNLLVNPFAPQMCVSLFERLWRRGFPVHMLNEQYRLAEGLEEVFNQLFYDGRITNHPSTRIDNRPAAQRAIQYIRRQWHKHDGIPHILLNVPTGACLRGETFSRFNPHNIAVTANTIRGMLLEGLWTEREITVMTPYREQAKRYRELFRKLRWFHVEVLTVDSMQGQENKCTIFDLVLARSRLGGPGFVVDKHRLNVALSRSQDMFIMVADTEALSDQKDATYERNNPLPGYHEDSNTKDVCKQLRKVFAYFISKGMVHLTNPSRFPELQQLDLTKLDEFEARKQALAVAHICRNCGAEGHKARECDQASVHLPRCYKCRQLGHRQGECRRVRCHNCGQLGHSVAGCKQVKCFRCLELGHDKAHCTNAPRQKLRFSMPGGEDIMKLARELGSG